MMHRRDLQRIDRGIYGLHGPWIAAEVLVEMIKLPKERMREDVFLRAAAKQERLDWAAAFHSSGAKRRHKGERLDRRWLVHVDARVQKKFDRALAPAEHGELQKMGGMRCGDEDVRRMFHELT